jgi:SAM-dependent MidA family methyltransferase
MRMCLTADIGGYYTGAIEEGRDQFGLKGDFVTSPEISQVFGELCGIWFVTEWMAQGRKTKGVELIEVGPGRGTLMDDMLRVSLVGDSEQYIR